MKAKRVNFIETQQCRSELRFILTT